MLGKVLLLLAAVPVAIQPRAQLPNLRPPGPVPTTGVYDGMPPPRFQRPHLTKVAFGTVAACGDPGPKFIIFACTSQNGVVHMPDPCQFPDDRYAVLMCHEMAHTNGWPFVHGE